MLPADVEIEAPEIYGERGVVAKIVLTLGDEYAQLGIERLDSELWVDLDRAVIDRLINELVSIQAQLP